MNNEVLKLHSDIFYTKGKNRSILIDFNRKKIEYIPNSMTEILDDIVHKEMRLESFAQNHSEEDLFVIQEYFEYLLENEYAFYTNTPELFPRIHESIELPGPITNAIIDIGQLNIPRIKTSVKQLSELNCPHLEVRVYSDLSIEEMERVVLEVSKANFRSIQLSIQHNESITIERTKQLFSKNNSLLKIIVSGSASEETIKMGGRILRLTKSEIVSENDCGYVHLSYFNLNRTNYFLGKNHNSCLYGKVSIDQHGNIKNCPAMNTSFGDIESTSIEKIISQDPEFKKMWGIKKDEIKECKQCELRYICSDCRAFTKNDDLYSKPSRCNYEV